MDTPQISSYLILYKSHENKFGTMLVNANSVEEMQGMVDTELNTLFGPGKQYKFSFADLQKQRAHIYDVVEKERS